MLELDVDGMQNKTLMVGAPQSEPDAVQFFVVVVIIILMGFCFFSSAVLTLRAGAGLPDSSSSTGRRCGSGPASQRAAGVVGLLEHDHTHQGCRRAERTDCICVA